MTDTTEEPKLEEIAISSDSVYDAILQGTADSMQDLVERVADTGATRMERDVEFGGQTWAVTVLLKSA